MQGNPAIELGDAMSNDYATLIANAASAGDKIKFSARWILDDFDAFYEQICHTPALAQQAFEQRDWRKSVALSKQRLLLYSTMNNAIGENLERVFPEMAEDAFIWDEVENYFLSLIEGRYEADVAYAYIHSVRRRLYLVEWQEVEYVSKDNIASDPVSDARVYSVFPCNAEVVPDTIIDVLKIPNFTIAYRSPEEDARHVAERINQTLAAKHAATPICAIEMIDAGFFRNRGGYLVGRLVLKNDAIHPLILALLNTPEGIYIDAVMCSEADAHNLFSSTLANFHVTHQDFRGVTAFLHSIMPTRPLGLHYTTIGFNHVGKVAVMSELKEELASAVFDIAAGSRGTVAIGFSAPSSAYNLKVIRDKPTDQYKWGEFAGIDSVLNKYRQVHEINRTGSMLDNIIYYRIRLKAEWFNHDLMTELLTDAGETVSRRGDYLFFKHLIVQRRLTPLPVFLQTAEPTDVKEVMSNLGYCIKNNAAANIFNKDLDARNYGVSRFRKVYLFDYDALEPFTDVKIRTNIGTYDGEEDVPDWVFEDGVIFLPEEIEVGLNIDSRPLRRLFRSLHSDLLTVEYWEHIQNELLAGHVPNIRTYPESRELKRN